MNMIKKILSALLAALMIFGSLTVVTGAIPLYDEEGKKITEGDVDYEVTVETYLEGKTPLYTTPQEKLASMQMMWEKHGYQLWIDDVTGEVATVKVATGEILFTNPWDTANAQYTDEKTGTIKTTSLEIKKWLLSQIVVNYTDNGNEKTMYSCVDAAMRNQIDVEYIKNGIRVEYSIGREEARMLVPKLINKERFETKILKPMREYFSEYYDELLLNNPSFNTSGPAVFIPSASSGLDQKYQIDIFQLRKVAAFYTCKDPSLAGTDRERSEMETAFPITKKMAVYVIDPGISATEMTLVESYIKNYAPTYTYEDLDYDHELTEYVGVDKAPPLFKMALEYSVDEQGMTVRLPANGIRFDESLYQLTNIEMLPYMGAGSNDGDWNDGGDGYTFFPDGSGALFDFQDLNTGKNKTVSGKVYGLDYAYHNVSGMRLQEVIRYPVFGIVDYWSGQKTVTDYDTVVKEAVTDEEGNVITPAEYATSKVDTEESRGFVAIIEEGDAMAELSTYHMSATSIYNTVKMIFYPRPRDSYNMSDAISVGANTIMTVVSSRKYVGNYKVRYIMLSDDELAKEGNLSRYYETSWMGMAVAYRDYLEANNYLNRLTEDDIDDDIPLYIETFGTLMTTEKILSIPVDLMTPLTSFEDIKTMYTELSDKIESEMAKIIAKGDSVGVTNDSAKKFSNINFKLTGYANGGMFSSVPYNLNWEAAVGGEEGFEELLAYAKQEGFELFPDFDFVYINSFDTFDGVSLKEDAVKTIDNRYTSRREYSATYQTEIGYFQYAIAPSSFEKFVTKFSSNYIKYNPTGISVSTLGTDLNSDFDEDDPLNREDSKEYTMKALAQLTRLRTENGESVDIMTDGGNAYTWRYVDYIVNMPLNSSRYNDSSNAVPFIGVVLHGYVQFAGSPINEEGDIEYAFLKAIENGASVYFTLAYQNTQNLKDSEMLSQHFSVRYDIWKDDMVEMYAELNNLLCDLQTKLIIDHDFLTGERVPDADEIIADEEALKKAEEEEKAIAEIEATKAALQAALKLRHTPTQSVEMIESAISSVTEQAITVAKYAAKIDSQFVATCAQTIKQANAAKTEAEAAKQVAYDEAAYLSTVNNAYTALSEAIIANATANADKIFASAVANEKDAAKLAAMKEAVNVAQETVISTAIGAGAAEIFRQTVNEEGTYSSTAEAKAAALKEAEVVVDAIINATYEAVSDANAAAPAEYAALVANVTGAISESMLNAATTDAVLSAVSIAQKTYESSVTANEKLITTAANAAATLTTAINTAIESGITSEQISTAIALKNAAELATQRVSELKALSNNYSKAVLALVSATRSYFDEVEKVAKLVAEGKAANVVSAIATIIDYESSDEEAKIYELTAATDKTESSQNTADARRKTADGNKAKVDALDAAVVAEAQAVIAQAKADVAAYAKDCSAEYETILSGINTYFDAVEAIYTKAVADDTAMAEILVLINEQNRANEIAKYAANYAAANNNFVGQKALYVANANVAEVNAKLAAIDATAKTKANSMISDDKGQIKPEVAKLTKAYATDDNNTLISAAAAYTNNAAAVADRDAQLADYAEYAANIEAAQTAETETKAALSTEAIAVALADAKAALKAARDAYTAKATADEVFADGAKVTVLLDKIKVAKLAYDTAKAAYELQKALVESTFGATAQEVRDLETKKTAMDRAQNDYQALQDEYETAYNASACKAELDAIVTAYNNEAVAQDRNAKMNSVLTAEGTRVGAIYSLDEKSIAAVNKASIYAQLESAINASTSDYLANIKTVSTAFSRISSYYKSAQLAAKNAEDALVKLDERRDITKANAAKAEITYRIYAAAKLLKAYTLEELQSLANAESITDDEKINYANAIAAASSNLAALKSAYENAAEADKANAELIYNIALTAEEKTADEIEVLYKEAASSKTTADREVRSAEQFYNTAVSETATAQQRLAELKAIYDANYDIYNGVAMLEARVFLFGDANLETYTAAANKDIITANDLIESLLANINNSKDQWAVLERAAKSYKEAKAAYDELNAKIEETGIENMTEEEITEYRSLRVYYSYKMVVAKNEIDAAKTVIESEFSLFRRSYSNINSAITTLTTAVTNVEAEAESARLLYEAKSKDASISATELAELKAIADKYQKQAETLRIQLESISNILRYTICEQAYEMGMLSVTDTTASVSDRVYNIIAQFDKHIAFINDAYGIVEEEEVVEETTKYTCDDGSIVAVIYGGKDGNDSSAYRTFLLNYNAFAVTVEYNGVLYELGAYSYLVINH